MCCPEEVTTPVLLERSMDHKAMKKFFCNTDYFIFITTQNIIKECIFMMSYKH